MRVGPEADREPDTAATPLEIARMVARFSLSFPTIDLAGICRMTNADPELVQLAITNLREERAQGSRR